MEPALLRGVDLLQWTRPPPATAAAEPALLRWRPMTGSSSSSSSRAFLPALFVRGPRPTPIERQVEPTERSSIEEQQLQRPAAIKKMTLVVTHQEKKPLRAVASQRMKVGSTMAPTVVTTTSPKASSQHSKQQSPRACLCSPTMHAGLFRCRLHRGYSFGPGPQAPVQPGE